MKGSSDEEVNLFIQLSNSCEKYHCLPRSGGIFDQDSYIMYGLNAIGEALAIKADREKSMPKEPQMTPAPRVPRARKR